MALKEQVYSVLIVSDSESFNNAVSGLLAPPLYQPIKFCGGINEAKRITAEQDFDFILVNSPLPDDNGIRFSIDSCRGNTVVLMLIKTAIFEGVSDKVTSHGVFALQKPTSKPAVMQALSFMISTRERLRQTEKKNASLEERMEEIRIINRAKCLLISELKMSESEAHRYIEKSAMDNCVSKRATAETIIKTYS